MKTKHIMLMLSFILAVTLCYSNPNEQFLGFWIGTIQVMEVEIEFHLDLTEADDEVIGLLSIPSQYAFDLPISDLTLDYPSIRFRLVPEGGSTAHIRGSMNEGGYISGDFSQAGVNGRFHLQRAERDQVQTQAVLPPLEGEIEVSVETNFGRLYGSLVTPPYMPEMPLVIIVAGSGPTDRDGNNPFVGGRGYVYRQIAEELRSNGIASLRYDKRGIGKSSEAIIKEEDLRVNYLVRDVVFWIERFQQDKRFSEIIIMGHSEGALVGMIAGQRVPIGGFISVAGPGRNLSDVLIEQLERQPEEIQREAREILASLRIGEIYNGVSDALKPVFREQIQAFLLSMIRYNPWEEIGKLQAPVLIVQGTTDLQISVEDAHRLSQGNDSAELVIIEGMNHMMRATSDDLHENISSYGNPDLPLVDEFVRSVVSFIEGL